MRSGGGNSQKSQGPMVPGSQGPKGPKDQVISKSYSNRSLTLKKVHLVLYYLTVLATFTSIGPTAHLHITPSPYIDIITYFYI